MSKGDLPEDYEQCGECGFDHDYEYAEAYRYHSKESKMKYGIVVLVNDDVHAVYSLPEQTQTAAALPRIREGIAACNNADVIESIRIQRCILVDKDNTDEVIQDINDSLL